MKAMVPPAFARWRGKRPRSRNNTAKTAKALPHFALEQAYLGR
jgi:hypothetical protein